MNKKIKPDPISLTVHQLHMCFIPTNLVISSGTGFIYSKNESLYLITNWHNVSGRNPQTSKCLSDHAAVPDVISTLFRCRDNSAMCKREQIPLRDEETQDPLWLEHPIHGQNVDVVAIKLSDAIVDSYQLFPINELDFEKDKEEVADEVFVVGFPFSDMSYLNMPIWKKASIASEPDIDQDKLPKFLIDTATRPGLSGSPAIMQRTGVHGLVNGGAGGFSSIGTIRNFLGVYSGRIGSDELKAQLGVVWKAKVIDEIIDAVSGQ